jgi:hypothetical protein
LHTLFQTVRLEVNQTVRQTYSWAGKRKDNQKVRGDKKKVISQLGRQVVGKLDSQRDKKKGNHIVRQIGITRQSGET